MAWFEKHGLAPRIIAEFDDSALLKSFGQAGLGIFAAPSIIEDYVRNHGVRSRRKGGRESSMACP